jgi:arginine N-succinyltransferase
MLFVRPAVISDLPDLAAAAQHLDSVNLPHDEAKLREVIRRSNAAFATVNELTPGPAPLDVTPTPLSMTAGAENGGQYLFVMVERESRGPERVIGSSMIFAQHGSRRAPHSYFDVFDDERYSETLDRHFRHKVLRIGYNYDGLTELGGLVLLPEFRGHPDRLGKSLVFVRFLYIALHRAQFRDQMVSELMPPLEPDGTSLLWEALGRHFTGLSYQEADRLSRENKEFIRALFPQDPIYATLLPPAAQALIGQVGPNTKAVEKMLTSAGFRYAQRIDPFDGGPHFHARTDEVVPIRTTRRVRVRAVGSPPAGEASIAALVATVRPQPPFFLALRAQVTLGPGGLVLPDAAAELLGVSLGDEVGVLPL